MDLWGLFFLKIFFLLINKFIPIVLLLVVIQLKVADELR